MRKLKERIEKAWLKLQEKLSLFFVIGAALSIGNAVSSVSFIIDLIKYLIDGLKNIKDIYTLALFIADIISDIFIWWRSIIDTIFGWINFHPPAVIRDIISSVSFIIGRAINLRSILNKEIAILRRITMKAEFDKEMYDYQASQQELYGSQALPAVWRYDALMFEAEAKAKAAKAKIDTLNRRLLLSIFLLLIILLSLYFIDFFYINYYKNNHQT